MTRPGRILREFPHWSVDIFSHIHCTAYFLTHAHTDHCQGLSNEHIANARIPIYCSEETCQLLLALPQWQHLKNILFPLSLETPHSITYSSSETVTVTLLPANHCPGAVMFMFQGQHQTVLYTGDIRSESWWLDAVCSQYSVHQLDNIYIDATFCSLAYTEILPISQATAAIMSITKERGRNERVYFDCNMLGYESIYEAVWKQYQTAIHVSSDRFRQYKALSRFSHLVSDDCNATRFHAGCDCPLNSFSLILRPCALFFGLNGRTPSVPIIEETQNVFRILYSMHSSRSELLEMIRRLAPRSCDPIALPNGIDVTAFSLLIEPFLSKKIAQKMSTNQSQLVSGAPYKVASALVPPPKAVIKRIQRQDVVPVQETAVTVENIVQEPSHFGVDPDWHEFIDPIRRGSKQPFDINAERRIA